MKVYTIKGSDVKYIFAAKSPKAETLINTRVFQSNYIYWDKFKCEPSKDFKHCGGLLRSHVILQGFDDNCLIRLTEYQFGLLKDIMNDDPNLIIEYNESIIDDPEKENCLIL
jgi:hypothetical protein